MNKTAVELRNKVEIKGLNPDFAKLVEKLVENLWKTFEPLGFYPLITDGNRTLAEQKELYAQGRTKPGKIVTYTLNSNHIGGRAVDIAFIAIDGGGLTYNVDWDLFGSTVRSIPGLGWGGDWKGFRDRPHVEFLPEEVVEEELTDQDWCELHFPEVDWVRSLANDDQSCLKQRLILTRLKEWGAFN